MVFKYVLWEKKEQIGILTINRPEVRNALNPEAWEEIQSTLEAAEDNPHVRVVIITGAGGKAFCGGADIGHLLQSTMWDILRRKLDGIFAYIHNFPKPIIAAINGVALGGGCELAMACDFCVASENAKLGQPEINLGLFPGGGATQRLQRFIGVGRAKELIFTGDLIDAREAERIGLVNKVFGPEELMDKALEIAKKMCLKSPLALRLAKGSINMGMEIGLQAGLAYEKLGRTIVHGSEDRVEGTKAFLEKRKPEFKGR